DLTDDLGGEVAVGRVADGQRLGDGVRLADGPVRVPAVLDGGADGTAAGRLSAVKLAGRLFDQADRGQLAERLVDLADQAAARHRADDVLWRAPAELLGDLEAEGLGSLGIVGPKVDVHQPPAVLVRDLRAQPVHLVI